MARVVIAFLVTLLGGVAAEAQVTRPYESEGEAVPATRIDELVLGSLDERGIQPAYLCSDEVFFRRVHLDVTGTLPDPDAFWAFIRDRRATKRAALIETLLARPEFADYWAMKWGDVLRIKAEFPINLWPNAVQAYHRWVRTAIRDNKPYDQFARELLTSSGSNFRVPPVNFYRATQGRGPGAIADAVALTFMGLRLGEGPRRGEGPSRDEMAAFFSRVSYKGTAEWKEEIVFLDPAPAEAFSAVLPGGQRVELLPNEDPRRVFADWLTAPENPWFTRCITNRVWAWLMGRGIIHEPDDIRPDNPPANPELLTYLEEELVKSGYDLKHLYRLILNSQTYQRSSIPRSDDPDAAAFFAHYPVRRLEAEVLIDALSNLFGPNESYVSAIPEPYTFIPRSHRTITLADGSTTSMFLDLFGRPSRDTGLESERRNDITASQRSYLLNASHIQDKIRNSWRLTGVVNWTKGDQGRIVLALYIRILSRRPTPAESAAIARYVKTSGLGRRKCVEDLAWSLINSKEFLYRH